MNYDGLKDLSTDMINPYLIEDPNSAQSGKDFAFKLGDSKAKHTVFCNYQLEGLLFGWKLIAPFPLVIKLTFRVCVW